MTKREKLKISKHLKSKGWVKQKNRWFSPHYHYLFKNLDLKAAWTVEKNIGH